MPGLGSTVGVLGCLAGLVLAALGLYQETDKAPLPPAPAPVGEVPSVSSLIRSLRGAASHDSTGPRDESRTPYYGFTL